MPIGIHLDETGVARREDEEPSQQGQQEDRRGVPDLRQRPGPEPRRPERQRRRPGRHRRGGGGGCGPGRRGRHRGPGRARGSGQQERQRELVHAGRREDRIHPGNLKDADVIAAIDEKKWGTATIPLDFGKRRGGMPTVKKAAGTYPTGDDFADSYVETALWSSNDESDPNGGEPLDKNYDASDIAPASLAAMKRDCDKFQSENRELLDRAEEGDGHTTSARQGHDFWLTRNGHGAGFWDGDYPETGKALAEGRPSLRRAGPVRRRRRLDLRVRRGGRREA